MGNYRLATIEVFKELNILDTLDLAIPRADAINLLAIIEGNLENFDEAIAYNEEALAIYNENNDQHYASLALSDIGLYYFHLEQFDSAMFHQELALPIAEKLKSRELQSVIKTNMGKSQLAMNNSDKAVSLFTEGLKIAEQIDSKNKMVEALNELGEAYFLKNDHQNALKHLSRSIDLSKDIDAKPVLAAAYGKRSQANDLAGNYRLAYQDHVHFKEINDSIYNDTKTQQIEELKTIYDTEKKQQQIVQQGMEIDLLEQKEKSAKLQKLALGGGLGLALLTLCFGYYGYRQRLKTNQIAKEKVEAELAFKKKELVTHALHLAKKNEVLESIKQKALEQKKVSQEGASYQKLVNIINLDIHDDDSWKTFTRQFQEVHADFYSTVTKAYPNVTPSDMRLMSLIKMNLSSKEMANILNISIPGIKKARQRLRKKMELETKDSLEQAVLSIT